MRDEQQVDLGRARELGCAAESALGLVEARGEHACAGIDVRRGRARGQRRLRTCAGKARAASSSGDCRQVFSWAAAPFSARNMKNLRVVKTLTILTFYELQDRVKIDSLPKACR